MENAEWYVEWFNSPYYHLLYNNRNYSEANFFIDNLCTQLKLGPKAKIWDLACGKGRHAVALNKKGYDVIGTDLSVNNIAEASKQIKPGLEFFVHDMRQPFKISYFDAVFNLFTSIGYFKDFNDNYSVFKNVALALKHGGVFVIDFFNSNKIISSFKPDYTEKRESVTFEIKKKLIKNSIIKHIEFTDNGKKFFFEESVSLLVKRDFENFAKEAGLVLKNCFGNYSLEPFDEQNSDRLILIFKK
jgi:SAM-dependent methyltransferase